MTGNLRDTLNLVSKLTPGRLANASRVVGSYYRSRLTRNPVHPAHPISISVEPTTSCNLRCPECPSGLRSFSRPTGMLDPDFFRRVIDDVYRELLYINFYFQGEPFLHPAFTDMVHYASEKKIYTATSTNAHYLSDEMSKKTVASGLDRLVISIDGSTQEAYEQYRIGGSLEKVLDGTKNLVHWKKALRSFTPHLIFQCLVVRPNEHQVRDVSRLAKKMGVDQVVFKTAQVHDYLHGNELIPAQDKFSRYRKQHDGTFVLKNKLDDHCWKLWHSCVITWDGNVVPCCFDKDAAFRMGSLKEQTLTEIWNNESYRAFRSRLMKGRKEIDICRNCTEGTKVWA